MYLEMRYNWFSLETLGVISNGKELGVTILLFGLNKQKPKWD